MVTLFVAPVFLTLSTNFIQDKVQRPAAARVIIKFVFCFLTERSHYQLVNIKYQLILSVTYSPIQKHSKSPDNLEGNFGFGVKEEIY